MSVEIEDKSYPDDWSPVACARSYVSIPVHETRYNIIRKRGCEAGHCEKRTRLDWRARQLLCMCMYVCMNVCMWTRQVCEYVISCCSRLHGARVYQDPAPGHFPDSAWAGLRAIGLILW